MSSIVVAALSLSLAGCSGSSSGSSAPSDRPPAASVRDQIDTGPRIVFRHTGLDDRYGTVAVVPLGAPGGPRAFSGLACDRVDATRTRLSCLQTVRGATTQYRMVETDATTWQPLQTVSLDGVPNRTRLSPDGTLVASTVFVTGHSYEQTAFSTVTEVRKVGGAGLGNLESFRLVIDGRQESAADRNVWGVTFAADDRTFYVTVATAGRTYLVRGDLATRTLTSIRQNAECPSLSPDGTRVAYKVAVSDDGTTKHWTPAVLDLATGNQQLLSQEVRSVDDQIEWLDDTTILYGLPRPGAAGVDDVWAIDTNGTDPARLFIGEAWSPAVVR